MKKWLKWLLGIIAFIILILFVGGRFLSKHWSPIIEDKLRELVHRSSHGLYELRYTNLDFDPSFGNLTLDSVELVPDTTVYKQLVQAQKAPNNQFHVKLDKIQIKHISLAHLFFKKKLCVSSVFLTRPEVEVLNQHQAYNDSIPVQEKKSVYDDIKDVFKSVAINLIQIDTIDFTYTKLENNNRSTVSVKKMNLALAGILIDQNSVQDTARLLFAESIQLHVPEFSYNLSDQLYTAAFKSLHIDSKKGLASIAQVQLHANDQVYDSLVVAQKAPANRLNLTFDSLQIRGFDLAEILLKRKLVIDQIQLAQPIIKVDHNSLVVPNTPNTVARKNIAEQLQQYFGTVKIAKIDLQKIDFSYVDRNKGQISSLNFLDADFSVEDVRIDSAAMQDSTRIFYAKMIDLKLPSFTYNLPDNIYYVSFNNLHLNTRDRSVSFGDVAYKSKLTKSEFYRLKKKNIAMNDVSLGAVRLEAIDFSRLLKTKELFAQSARVTNGVAAFYQDLRYPHRFRNMIGHDPYQQLMKIKSNFFIDTVYVDNVSVRYGEHSARVDEVGTITFENATGVLTNVTNDKLQLATDRFMRADLRARVMDKGLLHVKFSFDMLRKGGYYTYDGVLAPMSMPAFNRILEPLAGVQLASGQIKKITFKMQATNVKNWGEFKFDYTDLKVNILTLPKDSKDLKAQKTLSFLVNKVLVNSSNPDAKGNYIVGKINYKRVPNYPFFKTLWQSLLQGIVQCVGISPEKEAKLLSLAVTGGKAVSEIKKGTQEVGKVAKDVGHEVGKAAKSTDTFFKNLFHPKKKDDK